MENAEEIKFHKLLHILAKQCNFVLEYDDIHIYDELLSSYGYESLNKALHAILTERRGRDPFPSIGEIKAFINPETDPNLYATSIAHKVWQAVAKWGYNNGEQAKQWVGYPGSEVIAQYGWNELCQTPIDHAGVAIAHLTKLAKSVISEQKRHERIEDRTAVEYENREAILSLGKMREMS